jgi:hypothetical protein
LASALVRGPAVEGGENQSVITRFPLANSTRGGSNIVGGSTASNHPVNGVVEYQVGNHGYITLQQGNNGVDESSIVTEATPHRHRTNHRGNAPHNDRLTTIENQLASLSTVLKSIQHQFSGSTGLNHNAGTDASVTSEQIHNRIDREPIDLHPIQVKHILRR